MKKVVFVGKHYLLNGKVTESKEKEIVFEKDEGLIYEVIRIIEGKPLFFLEHIERIRKSITITKRDDLNDFKEIERELKRDILKLITVNKMQQGNVQIVVQVDEGVSNRYVYFIKHSYPSAEQYDSGVFGTIINIERKNPNAKVFDWKYKKKVKQLLDVREAYEGLLVDRDGYITEGSRSNIFFVNGNEVYTSPKSDVLMGITRAKVIEVLKEDKVAVVEKKIKVENINQYEGVFMSGTSPEILHFCRIDEIDFKKSGKAKIKETLKLYRDKCRKDIRKFEYDT